MLAARLKPFLLFDGLILDWHGRQVPSQKLHMYVDRKQGQKCTRPACCVGDNFVHGCFTDAQLSPVLFIDDCSL